MSCACQGPCPPTAIAEQSWFYSDPANVERLRDVMRSWRGTPFRENHCMKGVGVDCVRFAEAVHRETGALPTGVQFPAYKAYGKGTEWLDMLYEELGRVQNLHLVMSEAERSQFKGQLIPGDVLVFSSGAAFHHLAVFQLWPSCWSAFPNGLSIGRFQTKSGGVIESHLTDPLVAKLLQRVYRFEA